MSHLLPTAWSAAVALIAVMPAQEPPPREPPPRLVIDDARVRAWTRELIPSIEQVSGREFTAVPKFLISDPSEVGAALTQDLAVQFRHLYPDADEAAVQRVARLKAGSLALSMMGKYGMESRVLYVMPDQLKPLLDLYDIDRVFAEAVLKMVLTHELVHALQDQHVDLRRKLRDIADHDRRMGLSCTIEGHAVFVSERVAERDGFGVAIGAMRRMMTTDPRNDRQQAALAFGIRGVRLMQHTLYETSRRFVEHHHGEGGNDRLWQMLAARPPCTAEVFRPTTYDAGGDDAPDLSKALAGVKSMFGRGTWVVGRGRTSEIRLRSQNMHAPAEELDEALADLVSGYFVEAMRGAALRQTVTVLVFADDSAAERFTTLATASAQADADRISGDRVLQKYAEVGLEDYDDLVGVWGRRYRQQPMKMGRYNFVPGEVVWMRRGRHVVEVELIVARRKREEIAAIGEAVFAELQK